MTASTHIIRPTDFNKNTADPNRNTWQAGQIRHIMNAINAVEGATTMIETATGLMQTYTIVGVIEGGCGRFARATLRHTWVENGIEKHQDTRFPLFDIGAIIVTTPTFMDDPRSAAIRSHADEASQLILQAQADHGEKEGRSCGKWDATPGAYDRTGWVTYTPHTGNPAFADRWGTRWYGTVTLPKVAQAA